MNRAGRNIRYLAFQRRLQAAYLVCLAIAICLFPWWATFFFQSVLASSVMLPQATYIVCFLVGVVALYRARFLLIRAKHADQGAEGERAIARIVSPLEQQGWTIEYGIRDRRVGDIDLYLRSPKGRHFSIDVKSHRCKVVATGEQLLRVWKNQRRPFEKDFLKQAKRQALVIQSLKDAHYVMPMVVFSNASVEVEDNQVAGVYVVSAKRLISLLRRLG